jgi:hypothetical protein
MSNASDLSFRCSGLQVGRSALFLRGFTSLGCEFPDVVLFAKKAIAFRFRDDDHAQARQASYQAAA